MQTTYQLDMSDNRVRVENLAYDFTQDFLEDDNNVRLTSSTLEPFAIAKQAEVEQKILSKLKKEKIAKIHNDYDNFYTEYLSTYPKGEVASFTMKANEASAWNLDNSLATPYIDLLSAGDVAKRLELLNAVLEKVTQLANAERLMVRSRDQVKACIGIEQFEALGSLGSI
jgi:hypothetical protein